jgi:hypothetical protein
MTFYERFRRDTAGRLIKILKKICRFMDKKMEHLAASAAPRIQKEALPRLPQRARPKRFLASRLNRLNISRSAQEYPEVMVMHSALDI